VARRPIVLGQIAPWTAEDGRTDGRTGTPIFMSSRANWRGWAFSWSFAKLGRPVLSVLPLWSFAKLGVPVLPLPVLPAFCPFCSPKLAVPVGRSRWSIPLVVPPRWSE
jgi:hypothetical protein